MKKTLGLIVGLYSFLGVGACNSDVDSLHRDVPRKVAEQSNSISKKAGVGFSDCSRGILLKQFNNYLDDSDVWGAGEIAGLAVALNDQEFLYNACLSFVRSGNPANAVSYAKYLEDKDKKYDIAKRVIERRNFGNGLSLLSGMPVEYRVKGISLLESYGQFSNARKLRSHVGHNASIR